MSLAFRGEFLSVNDVCALLEQSEQVENLAHGSLLLHRLRHDSRGEVLLIQGPNGEFVLVSQS